MEESLSNIASRFGEPISTALSAADVPLSSINSVILFGGNTRVPIVQSAIKSILGGDEKIAQNVNSDEAAVLGAAFYGAALSRQFKMKNIEVVEHSVQDFRLEPAEDVLFPAGSILGEKKALVLSPVEDLTLEFSQGR